MANQVFVIPGIWRNLYLNTFAGGDTIEDILNEFTDLERPDILACIAYASALMN